MIGCVASELFQLMKPTLQSLSQTYVLFVTLCYLLLHVWEVILWRRSLDACWHDDITADAYNLGQTGGGSLPQSIEKQVHIRGVQDEHNVKQEEENLDKTAATHRQVEAAREHKGIITDTKNPTIELGLLEEEEALITVDNSGQHSKPGENGENHFDQYPVLKQPIWSVPDPGTEMPPMDAFVLSKAMIEVRAEKNVIAVTFANFAFLDFVFN